jgi:hypothetical protein
MRDSGRIINKKELLKKLPDHLQVEISDLKKHDARIKEALKDREMAQLFFTDPGQALEKIGVPVSPELKDRLAQNKLPPASERIKSYTLRNGQTVDVKVNVKYTPREES